jgi:hypothetical protein
MLESSHASKRTARPDITSFIAGVKWCSRPNVAPSSLLLRVQRHKHDFVASDNTASAKEVLDIAYERRYGAGEGETQ